MADEADNVALFIERWGPSGGGERSNYQMFLTELCELIGAPKPEPRVEDNTRNAYVFEKTVARHRLEGVTTTNFIDLYKRGCFVLEAKQSKKRLQQAAELSQQFLPGMDEDQAPRRSAQWDTLMRNAREQAEGYAKRLPPEEGWPPFLITVDVGHAIELWADFSLQGKHYAQFPDRQSFRVYLEDLRDDAVRERLRLVWSDPQVLDPARRTAEVTRDIAEFLAKLSKGLEMRMMRALPENKAPEKLALERRAIAEKVALFLMRCLFTMFAEDVGLLTRGSFVALLNDYLGKADKAHFALERLWKDMNEGNFSPDLKDDVLRFNGGLFINAEALQINEDELFLLIMAAERDWQNVEPAIFGTLLERALDPSDRHKLGAHYTPRAYVERLVVETVIDPLKDEWRDIQAAAAQHVESGKRDKARDEVRAFHRKLCETKVLDPACGTGNFLYVTMELMKRLEGEVLETLSELGESDYLDALDSHTVDPHQFLGMELNPRAVPIAELVLWIGYLQWHFRTRGRSMPAEPVLKNFANIKEQDAILTYDSWDVLRDDNGRPVTRWDGITYKLHPITGEEIPDEAAQIELREYVNPRPAQWPKADYVVGNPPFIGKGGQMREALGDGYVDALKEAWPKVPLSADFVMYWWNLAAGLVSKKLVKRCGLITTNSIHQTFNSRIIERWLKAKDSISIYYAVPDHPWLKSAGRADVRIAMTVIRPGADEGRIGEVISENSLDTDTPIVELRHKRGIISSKLKIGADISAAKSLEANSGISWNGMMLAASGFLISSEKLSGISFRTSELVRPFIHGKDLNQKARRDYVIDTYGLEISDIAPDIINYLHSHVKPQRDAARDKQFREKWWLFGRNRPKLRSGLAKMKRYIATTETSKHRLFQFVDTATIPDHMVVALIIEDAFFLGVLSSRFHTIWALEAGGRLGVGNDPRYNKSRCFDPFPFPDATEKQKARIRDLAEQLDKHRKDVLGRHKQLTMTGLYNVLEKVRAGDELTDADKDVYEAGLVGVMRQLHEDLDNGVAEAYGWPHNLSEDEILERMVALNMERATEEANGQVRWLRPEFQAPDEQKSAKPGAQIEADLAVVEVGGKKPKFPTALPDQVAAVRAVLESSDAAISAATLSKAFSQGRRSEKRVEEVLRTLTLVGQAEHIDGGYVISS